MFHHAYDGYIEYAYPYDELRPLTCDGHDTWGRYVYSKWSDIILTSVYDRHDRVHLFVIVH
jgi:mannosidase alpha-like ER degradation enhancer 2